MLLLRIIYKEASSFLDNYRIDERITTDPILGSPLFMIFSIAFYLVLVLKILPRFMANRKPYKVEDIMKVYNVMQILLNAVIFYESLTSIYTKPDYSFTCEEYNPNDRRAETMRLVRPVALYYFSKFFDMFDTVFFILRKKLTQVSFLHVYHHSIMVFGAYIYNAKFFGSHFTSAGVVNSFIHVVMYTYYLIAAMKLNTNLDPWKKILTRMQLGQFILLGCHFMLPLINNFCNLERGWTWVVNIQNIFMIALFSNFYYRAYIRKSKPNKVH
ncbi:very long chain fatty acid elongase 7-like [Haematobia irritans]|uniref:very long chain fatty acid elongase 7-like n=1 Tax=Haematobia irritans TaxID=7368 RepID=UPI003F4F9F9E